MKDALALALLHFIWQGAVLALAGGMLMRVARVPSVKYAIGVATMAAMLAAPALTYVALQSETGTSLPRAVEQGRVGNSQGRLVRAEADAVRASEGTRQAGIVSTETTKPGVILPTTWILSVWAIGVAILSLRFLGGWAVARRLATQTLTPVGEDLQQLATRLAARLNVRGVFRVCESASVAVPIMVGWLRPVIVMPPAALAALPLAQLEALLAHEFAHIRRHDYLVNLLQTGVETVCFYHPAVWWVSSEVRRHREQCCDDVAVRVCDRLTYVTALSTLASISTPQFALSATGGSLRDRVRRLVEPTTHTASAKGAWMAMLPILLVASFVAPHAWGDQSVTPATVIPVIQAEPVRPVADEVRPSVRASIPVAIEPVRPVTIPRRATAASVIPEVESAVPVPVQQAETVRPSARLTVAAQAHARRLERTEQEQQSRARTAAEVRRRNQEARTVASARRLEFQDEVRLRHTQEEWAALQNRLRQEEMALHRTRTLMEKGLVTRDAALAAEQQVAELRRHLEELARSHRTLAEREQVLRREVGDQERAVTERMRLVRRPHSNLVVLEAGAELQADDQLTIAVAGEPDLPDTYTVRSDGSIRFPFLGSIRVQGSTTSQVQSAIQKLISDKDLARNPVVTVSARRVK